jgi:hypothetical protein
VSTATRKSRAAVDIEDIESTKSEKLLAVVLTIFLLIGGIWTYQKIDDVAREATKVTLSPAEQAAQQRFSDAQTRVFEAEGQEAAAREELELRREAYRTALDAGQPAGDLESAYHAAEDQFEAAQAARTVAQAEVEAARPAAEAASARQAENFEHFELISFLARLAFVIAVLAAAYLLLVSLRKRRSRYFPMGLAAVGFAALLALFMAGDYVTRRVPIRRVRKRECPFCGFPVGENEHCEGCGRVVVAECATCAQPRRVGTLHCGACGHA